MEAGVGSNATMSLKDEQPSTEDVVSKASSAKQALLKLAAAGNRGFGASAAARSQLLDLVAQLESSFQAPAGEAWRSAAIAGSWAVIFTTSPDLVSLDRLPLPGWRTARIGQAFESNGEARNEIEFVSPLGSRINQTVGCTWSPQQSVAIDKPRYALTFQSSSTRLAGVLGFDVPAALPPFFLPLPTATGVFEASYLDDDLLIQRTQAGASGINVMVREL